LRWFGPAQDSELRLWLEPCHDYHVVYTYRIADYLSICRAMKELESILRMFFNTSNNALKVMFLGVCSRIEFTQSLDLLIEHLKLEASDFHGAFYNPLLE